MARFVPGRELARAFYEEVVGPLVAGTPHSAALVGTGSDVLGFDTERSTDHGWGPRMHVFVRADEVGRVRDLVDAGLPEEFRGWRVRYVPGDAGALRALGVYTSTSSALTRRSTSSSSL